MRINTQENPEYCDCKAWLDGVPVHEIGYCFEVDDEVGYIKFYPRIELESGVFGAAETEETRYGKVVIEMPSEESLAAHRAMKADIARQVREMLGI